MQLGCRIYRRTAESEMRKLRVYCDTYRLIIPACSSGVKEILLEIAPSSHNSESNAFLQKEIEKTLSQTEKLFTEVPDQAEIKESGASERVGVPFG